VLSRVPFGSASSSAGVESGFIELQCRWAEEEDVPTDKPTPEQHRQQAEAIHHITEAHRILNKLREEADKHPAPWEALVEAMQKLERALAILSVKTGGWL